MKTNQAKIILIIFCSIFVLTNLSAQSYSGGSGTSGDPYQIANKTDLKYLSVNSGEWSKHFVQTANIIFALSDFEFGSDFYNSGAGFIPIGNISTLFTGSYNGGGYIIDGLRITPNVSLAVGMFGSVSSTSIPALSNIGLTNVYISSNTTNFTGALAGKIGENDSTVVENCYSTGTVISNSIQAGGLIGYMTNGSLTRSYSTCTVQAPYYVGGLIGTMLAGIVQNCFAQGSVNATSGFYSGGFVGYTASFPTAPTITKCYSMGYVYGSDVTINGFVGNGVAGSNCFWDVQTSGKSSGGGSATGQTTAAMKTVSTYTGFGWDFTSMWVQFGAFYPVLQGLSNGQPPSVQSLSPADNGTMTNAGSNFIITLSEPIAAVASKNISIYTGGSVLVEQIAANSGKVSIAGAQITINPDTILFDGSYYVLIDAGAFEDAYGEDFSGIVSAATWNFTVSDPAPILQSLLPVDGDTMTYKASNLVLNFSESVTAQSGKNLTMYDSNDVAVEQIFVTSGKVIVSGSQVTVNPDTLFPNGNYYVRIDAGAFKDATNRSFAGIANDSTWNFSVQDNVLTLQSVSPADNSTTTDTLVNLTMTFLEPVTAQSGKNILLYKNISTLVEQIAVTDAKVTIAGSQVTINPASVLTEGYYSVLIDTDAFRNSANVGYTGIADHTTWNFSTVVLRTDTVPGNAISIPGTGSYVEVPFAGALNPSNNFTIEFWARLEGGSNYRCPLGTEDGGGQTGYYFYVNPDGNWQCWMGMGSPNGWSIIDGPSASTGVWYHIAMTYASGTQNFYVNGVLQGSLSATYANNTSFPLRIGALAESDAVFGWVGKLDEVRLWSVARTPQEIRETMHRTLSLSTSGLIAYYQLNEGIRTNTSDMVGGFNGTLIGSPTWLASTVSVGGGTSGSASGFTSGTTSLGTVSLTTTDAFDNAVDMTATKIGTAPNSLTGISGTQLNDRYWVINSFGTPGTFSANLTFTVPSTFTNNGAATAANYTLYHRTGNSDGTWSTAVASAASLTSTTITFNGITSFSQFAIGTDDPLPVELASFAVSSNRLNAELKWTTATEVNNYGFEIERSRIQNTEARSQNKKEPWIKAGFIEGNGTTNVPKEYSFTDKNISMGKYSYRLKQIDRDGKFSYSQTVETEVGNVPKIFALEQNYPNPFNPTTTISFTLQTSGKTSLKIYDAIGREVATLVNENLEDGVYYQKTFDASNLASGIYFARLRSNGKSITQKLMVMK